MNVILLEGIRGLGDLGDQVQVKPGYGRNYLLPKNKAVLATPDNIEYFASRRAELEKAANDRLAMAKTRGQQLDGMIVTIVVQASEEGKLYGSIGPQEIVQAIQQAGLEAQKQEVQLGNGPLKSIGEHEVQLHLHHGEVVATLKVIVEAAK